MIVQALTQQIPNGDGQPELNTLKAPEPFPQIVRHCLDPDPATKVDSGTGAGIFEGAGGVNLVHPPHGIVDIPLMEKMPLVEPRPRVRPEREDSGRNSFEDRHSEMDLCGRCGADSDRDSAGGNAEEGCGAGRRRLTCIGPSTADSGR